MARLAPEATRGRVRATRRSNRAPAQLTVVIDTRRGREPARTEDISFHGLCVRAASVHGANELIRFSVEDPHGDEPVRLMGFAARCEACEHGGNVLGLSLFGNDRAAERRWADIVRSVLDGAPPATPGSDADRREAPAARVPPGPLAVDVTAASVDPSPTPPPPAIQHGAVTLRSAADLEILARGGASLDGVFLLSETFVPAGSTLVLRVASAVGPESVQLTARVVRAVSSIYPDQRGLALCFDAGATAEPGWRALEARLGA